MQEEAWRTHLGIIKELSGKHLGWIWELFKNRLDLIWEAFGGLEAAEASRRDLEGRSQKLKYLSVKLQRLHLIRNFTVCF